MYSYVVLCHSIIRFLWYGLLVHLPPFLRTAQFGLFGPPRTTLFFAVMGISVVFSKPLTWRDSEQRAGQTLRNCDRGRTPILVLRQSFLNKLPSDIEFWINEGVCDYYTLETVPWKFSPNFDHSPHWSQYHQPAYNEACEFWKQPVD